MLLHILHSGLTRPPQFDKLHPALHGEFDAGSYSFSVLNTRSSWGRDDNFMRVGHGSHSPDIFLLHSSMFEFDILRMLRFALMTRMRAPWIVYILMLSSEEIEETRLLAKSVGDHFSKYFQMVGSQFSLDNIHAFITQNFGKISNLVSSKRVSHFGSDIVSRVQLDSRIGEGRHWEYDFAISFSGAQRSQARDIANALKGRGATVFFDEFETTELVGKNLAEELQTVYGRQSRYCVLLASTEYRDGAWTNQERRAAIDKAVRDYAFPYIIPVKIHDVELPGLSSSVAYLSWNSNPMEIGKILLEKLVCDLISPM